MSTNLVTEKLRGCPSGPRIRFPFLSISCVVVVVVAVVDAGGGQMGRGRPCGVAFDEVRAAGV